MMMVVPFFSGSGQCVYKLRRFSARDVYIIGHYRISMGRACAPFFIGEKSVKFMH